MKSIRLAKTPRYTDTKRHTQTLGRSESWNRLCWAPNVDATRNACLTMKNKNSPTSKDLIGFLYHFKNVQFSVTKCNE